MVHGIDRYFHRINILGQGTRHIVLKKVLNWKHRVLTLLITNVATKEFIQTARIWVGKPHHRLNNAESLKANDRHGRFKRGHLTSLKIRRHCGA